MNLLQELSQLIAGEVKSDPETLDHYSRDASLFEIKPAAVVLPKNVADIKAVVKYAAAHSHENVSVTVRSGGTCMSGGPLSTSIVIDINAHLNRVKEVGSDFATTEPGMFYRDFEAATLKKNLLMPSYPASRNICTVGGMVNNNAGGEKTLAYGKTEQYVRQLKVILRDGNEYTLEKLSRPQLEAKMQQSNLEGTLYRQMFELLEENYDRIQNAKPKVSKNSTGYNLWNIWDKKTFDLTQLFVGSQGTLGITTEITFRLIHPKPRAAMLVIFLNDLEYLPKIINSVLRYQPESFESYDDHTIKLALKFFPQLMKQMGASNIFSLTWQLLPDFFMVATGGIPKLVLLAEFTGHDAQEVHGRAEAAQAALKQYPIKTRVAKSEREAQKYWTIRHESFNLLRGNVRHKHTAPFIDDLTVRPEYLPKFLPRLNEILEPYDIEYTIAGHVGDGNFHIIPLMDLSKPDQHRIIAELAPKVYDLVFEFEGSMSGEHNDGLIRSSFLKQMYGEEVYALFAKTKEIFDPENIFNPGKKIGTDWDWAMKQMIHE